MTFKVTVGFLLVLAILNGHIQVNHAQGSQLVCEGDTLRIQCCANQYINVQSALYGRAGEPEGTTCQEYIPRTGLGCGDAANSLETVQDNCQNMNMCEMTVNNGNFGPDLCPNIPKYLKLETICQEQTTSPQTIAQSAEAFISCGSAQYIRITSAVYDRAIGANGTCTGDDFSTDAQQVVNKACGDRHECRFTANTDFFGGDPCGSVAKALQLENECSDYTSLSQVVRENDQIYIGCSVNQVIEVSAAQYGVDDKISNECGVAEDSLATVKAQCDNVRECDFTVTIGFFGGIDPCNGSVKYLRVDNTCINRGFSYHFSATSRIRADEGDGSFELRVLRSGSEFSSTIGVSAIGEDAVRGSDYGFTDVYLEFGATDSEKLITVSIEDDDALENEECLTLYLVPPAPMDNVDVETGSNATLCITDNDIDEEDPVLDCPANIVTETEVGTDFDFVWWSIPPVTDNSGEDLRATLLTARGSGAQFPIGTHTVTYEATDSATNTGSCSFTIEVKDMERPVLTGCPAQYNYRTESGEPYAVGKFSQPTAQDNSGSVTLSGDGSPEHLFPIGVSEILYIAVDAYGNTQQCTVSVYVHDEEDPHLVAPSECPPDVEVFIQDPQGDHARAPWAMPEFADNSGKEPTVQVVPELTADYSYPSDNTIVTIQARDDSANVFQCSFLVFVHEFDASPPQLIPCPPLIEPLMTDPGSDVASPIPFQIVAVDDQSDIRESSLSHDQPYAIGQNSVSLSAVNNAGVVGSCSFMVTVLDEENPSFVNCPGDQTISTRSSSEFGYPTWPLVTARDNSNDVTVSCSKQSGNAFDLGDTTVVCTARDSSDNTQTCSFTITVIDNNECTALSAVNDCASRDMTCFNRISGYSCECPVGLCESPTGNCLQGKLFVVEFAIVEMGGSEAVFTNDLNQPLSSGFLSLQDRMENILDGAFSDLTGFCRTTVSSFFSGSVGVTALVSVSESSSVTLADVTQHLANAIGSDSFLLGTDLKITTRPSVVQAESCYDGYCQNGGTCSTDGSTYRVSCLCLAGFFGDRCEGDATGNASALAVGLAVGGVALLVMVAALLACIALRWRAASGKRSDGLYLEDEGREVVARRPLYDYRRPTSAASGNIYMNKAFQAPRGGFFSPYMANGGELAVSKPKRGGLRDTYF